MVPETTRRLIDKDEIDFIERGECTQAEIKAKLGDPDLTVTNPDRWVYEMRWYVGNRWGACIVIPAGFGGYGDCGEISEGEVKVEYLYIEFDGFGTVSKVSTPAVRANECIEPGVCPKEKTSSESYKRSFP